MGFVLPAQASAAEKRARDAMRQARTDVKRLAAAEQSLKEGDISAAGMIFTRLAARRPATKASQTAKSRLAQLRQLAFEKRNALDAQLASMSPNQTTVSDSNTVSDNNAGSDNNTVSDSNTGSSYAAQVTDVFKQYATLARDFKSVPGLKLETHIRKQSAKPEYAAVVNEPAADRLWKLGRQYETEGSVCCAYRVYEQAAQLTPAPSARQAKARVDLLKQDSEVVASVATCRELEWCHRTYDRAERLLKTKPVEARKLYMEIARRAPKDSEIYRFALVKMR